MLASLTLTLAVAQGARPELGSRALAEPAALEVFLVDASGALLVEGWQVHVTHRLDGARVVRATESVDARSGVARFAGLGPEPCQVVASHVDGATSEPSTVALAPGERASVALTLAPHPRRRIELLADDLAVDLRGLATVGRDGRATPFVLDEGRARWVALGLAPELHRVVHDDPRFLPFDLRDVSPGTTPRAALVGSSSVTLRFVDQETGEVVAPTTIDGVAAGAIARTERTQPYSWRAALAGLPAHDAVGQRAALNGDGSVSVSGLVAGGRNVVAAGFARHEACHVALGVEPLRHVEVVHAVTRGRTVHGRLTDAAGRPVAGALVYGTSASTPIVMTDGDTTVSISGSKVSLSGSVRTRPSGAAGGLGRLPPGWRVERGGPEATTDPDGRFVLHALPSSAFELHCELTPWTQLESAVAAGVPGERRGAPVDVTLVAPGAGAADLWFRFPNGAQLADFDVALQSRGGPWQNADQAVAPLLDDRGRLRLRGLPEVEHRLVVTRRGRGGATPGPPRPVENRVFVLTPSLGAPSPFVVDLTDLPPNP